MPEFVPGGQVEMKREPPAGAIGFSRPPRGLKGLVGRLICWRQGLFVKDSLLPVGERGPKSHVRISLGGGVMCEQTMPKWRMRTVRQDAADNPDGIVWYAPPAPLGAGDELRLRAAAEALTFAGGRYSVWALIRFILTGTLGKGGWVCTSGAALLLNVAADIDFSGCGQPQNVDLRTLVAVVRNAGWQKWEG